MSLHKTLSMAAVLSLLCLAPFWPQTDVGQISWKPALPTTNFPSIP